MSSQGGIQSKSDVRNHTVKMKAHVLDGNVESAKIENKSNENNAAAVKSMNSVVFDSFKGLTSTQESERVKSGLQLLQHLARTQNIGKNDKEVKYVIKRLIRGVGASTTISRAGFFTTLVGFLEIVKTPELSAEKILSIAAKELHVGGSISNKEDADAIVGQILTCGALIRSRKIFHGTQEGIEGLCQTLIASSKHRTYHSALAYTFLVEFLENLSEDKFADPVWPILSVEWAKSWEKHTIHTVYCLIVATQKFPSVFTLKYLKTTFGGHSLLNARSANHLYKLFWENTSPSAITHPSYECFGNYIAKSKYLETFWMTEVDAALKSPTKLREIETLKIFSDILAVADPNCFQVSKYLTENFVNMMLTSLKRVKFKKEDTLKAFYDALLEALVKWTAKVMDDGEKVEMIKRLIFHPGCVNFEKYTSQRVIHQMITNLGEKGVKKLFEVYKNIFLANSQKKPGDPATEWLNVERQCAGYMLQHLIGHKSIQAAFEWRQEQLKFFMLCGLFYTNDGESVVSKKDDKGTITTDLALQMKNGFYSSLQSKLPRLQDERNVLFSLVEACNAILEKKSQSKFLRNPIDEKILKAWKEMYAEVLKDKRSESKLKLVFHVLLLHMGLQLFHEPDMAENAIWDLEKCVGKINQQSKKKSGEKLETANQASREDPDWIEVVVDLFLHLLSHNTSSLRTVVNAVFPHLCDSLSLTAVHQILSILDMQDGKNPLSAKDDLDDESMADAEGKNNEQSDDSDNEINESDEDVENEEDDEEDDEELVEEEEEENGYIDDLRNAVSKALIGEKNDDEVSVDLNDMDEEEGKRLDEALSGIFKSMIKPKQYKKTKGYRIETTTTMHFRTRVLDLIEIYINHKPNLLVVIEIMVTLFNMIEYCADSDLKSLANKVERVLGKLTALRHFTTVEDITEKNISDYLRLVVEKKVTAPVFDVHNKMKAKCCVFLIACSKILADKKDEQQSTDVVNLLKEYLDDFIKSRNPTITAMLLNDIFKMRWSGIWQLASYLVKNGLTESTRTYRRIQTIELVDTLYKNHELIRQDEKLAKKILKLIETYIQAIIQSLCNQQNVSVREFNTLLNVLFSAHRCHTRIPVITSYLNNSSLCENIQTIRKKVRLENAHNYARFCNVYGVKIIRNEEVSRSQIDKDQVSPIKNGGIVSLHVNGDNSREEVEEESETETKKHKKPRKIKTSANSGVMMNGKKKRKAAEKMVDTRKEKRLRKEGRMRALSKGMDIDDSNDGGGAAPSEGESSLTSNSED